MSRYWLIIAALLLFAPATGWAKCTVDATGGGQTCDVRPALNGLTALAPMQRITSLASAATLTVPTGAICAVITADSGTAALRWRDDGTNPTATIGMELASGSSVTSCTPATVAFIQEGTTPATPVLNVSFYK